MVECRPEMSLVVVPVHIEPVSVRFFPVFREFTGNFAKCIKILANAIGFLSVFLNVIEDFPKLGNREFLYLIREILLINSAGVMSAMRTK